MRKENQLLQSQVTDLQRQHVADTESLRAMAASRPTVPTLPPNRLDALFTATDLKFGRLTGFTAPDDSPPGLRVFVVPTDQHGDPIKAAGEFVVDATAPRKTPEPVLVHWTFPAADAERYWNGHALLYTYVLPCPWPDGNVPAANTVRIKVTFTDALTGRRIDGETRVSKP